MFDQRRRRKALGQPIAHRMHNLVLICWPLLFLVCVGSVGALRVQSNEVSRLTEVIGPALDANRQLLQAMTDAETGLHSYELSHDRAMLEPYFGAHTRTIAAMATVQDRLLLTTKAGAGAEAEDHARLEGAQRVAVQKWWVFATRTEQSLARGSQAEVFQGRALFNRFRAANASLGEHIRTDRDYSLQMTQTVSTIGTVLTIAATLVALVVAFVLGDLAARSISAPMTELTETVTRQRAGEVKARAREDIGSREVRSLAVSINALIEQNLGLQQAQAVALGLDALAFEIGQAIRSAPHAQRALDLLCAALGQGLGVDRVVANTVGADQEMSFRAQWHEPDLAPLGDWPDDVVPSVARLSEELWSSSEQLVLDDVRAPQGRFQEQALAFHGQTDARSVIMVPIGLGDRIIGAIYVFAVHEPRAWTGSEANTVQQVAAFVAWVIAEDDRRGHQNEYVDRLQQLDRQKNDFMATVSHELRTPLTSISGYLELLRDGDVGEVTMEQHRMLAVMDRNTIRLRDMVEGLLALNQIESGDLKVNRAPVSVPELITAISQELSPLAQGGFIELDVHPGPEAAIVQGDSGQLHSAVVNVIDNALKFSHPGDVVTVTCTMDQRARRVLITCQDQGIGIPAIDQAGLFTRFHRASNVTEHALPGAGLGLAIVWQIVESHGGEVRLTSVEGEGTTVVIDLPLTSRAWIPGGLAFAAE